jgi:hypothetical protein
VWIFLRVPQIAVNVLLLVYDKKLVEFLSGTGEVSITEELFMIFFLVGDVLIVQIVPFLMA